MRVQWIKDQEFQYEFKNRRELTKIHEYQRGFHHKLKKTRRYSSLNKLQTINDQGRRLYIPYYYLQSMIQRRLSTIKVNKHDLHQNSRNMKCIFYITTYNQWSSCGSSFSFAKFFSSCSFLYQLPLKLPIL